MADYKPEASSLKAMAFPAIGFARLIDNQVLLKACSKSFKAYLTITFFKSEINAVFCVL